MTKPREQSDSTIFGRVVTWDEAAEAFAVMARWPKIRFTVETGDVAIATEIISSERFKDAALHRLVYTDEYYCAACCAWFEFTGNLDHCPNCGHEYNPGDLPDDDPPCPKCGEAEYEATCPKCGVDGGNGGLNCSECWTKDIEFVWMAEWPLPNVRLVKE